MKQETKNKRLLALLLILVAATATLFFVGERETTIAIDKDIFRPADLRTVDRIRLESATDTVEIAFSGRKWRVNDRYDADGKMIQVLFATLQQAVPKRMAATSLRDSVKAMIMKNGVRVLLFSGDHIEKAFVAGGNAQQTQSWFYDEASDHSYLMHIPGYRVYVSGILELPENRWRDPYTFKFDWTKFESLTVEYPGRATDGFTVSQQGNHFGISELTKTDTARLNTFLDNVSLLTVNEYLDAGQTADSLRLEKPFMIVTVADVSGTRHKLELFRERRGQVPGLVDGNQAVIFHRLKIQPILRPKSFFRVQ